MKITVVGIGADGWSGLDPVRRDAVTSADTILGGDRHLAMLPADVTGQRVLWPQPLRAGLSDLLDAHRGGRLVALASGDPLVAGIGTTLIEVFGADAVEVLPAVSSVALARARMGWPAEWVTVLRDHRELPRHLVAGNRVLILSADGSTPAAVAQVLADSGFGDSLMTVFEDLGADQEKRSEADARSWHAQVGNLNVIAITCATGSGGAASWAAGLPDDAFDHDGQLTKRDARASALARLAPAPGQLLWDVGAGAGSLGIEWMRAHPSCRAVAIETRKERAKRIAENAVRLGVGSLRVVIGTAPAALAELPRPDAVFVGGGTTDGAGQDGGVLEAVWDALKPGGRIVVHGVTLQTEQILTEWHGRHGGELTRLHIEHAEPLGSFTGWKPSRAIVQWAAIRPAQVQE